MRIFKINISGFNLYKFTNPPPKNTYSDQESNLCIKLFFVIYLWKMKQLTVFACFFYRNLCKIVLSFQENDA